MIDEVDDAIMNKREAIRRLHDENVKVKKKI